MNNVSIIGRLVREPEMKQTQSGKSYVNLSIAVSRPAKNSDTDFFDCIAWDKTANLIGQYFNKGSQIAIVGKLRQERWQDKEGKNISKVIIDVSSVSFVGNKQDNQGNTSNTNNYQQPQQQYQQQAQPQQQQVQNNNNNVLSGLDLSDFDEIINDGDMPF